MIGSLVHDWALGRDGIVVDGAHCEVGDGTTYAYGRKIEWEWLVLYDGGELLGASTLDLKVIDENR